MHAPRQTGFPAFQFIRSLRQINLLEIRSHRKNKRRTTNEGDIKVKQSTSTSTRDTLTHTHANLQRRNDLAEKRFVLR